MKTISIVIPALNEEMGIGSVIREIPLEELKSMGYDVEILVIDNDSSDGTVRIAREHGAKVIIQPIRGYGNAYKAGFANAHGNIIATGDADCTYPFSILPEAIKLIEERDYDFINTDRLTNLNLEIMSWSHRIGNNVLTVICKILFNWPFIDSQSGMWIFKKSIWHKLRVKSSGMPFSQELKIRAYSKGFKCTEIPIHYRTRAGKEKLNTLQDGIGNILHLFSLRLSN